MNDIITLAMLATILAPIIMIGVADIKRHPIQWRKDHEDSDYMKAVKGGSKTLAEYHRKRLAEGQERLKWRVTVVDND